MPDDATYQRYIAPHESKLIAAAWRVLGNENDVGDAIQDALTRIWKNRKTLETHPNPTAWMLRIVAQAILLRLVEEMPYAEISEAMGCSEATARVHVKRGRENLQERLADLQPTSQGSHS